MLSLGDLTSLKSFSLHRQHHHHHHHSFVVFPSPPPPHFHCYTFTTTTISTTFLFFPSPSQPPPPHFFCFLSHNYNRHVSIVFPPPTSFSFKAAGNKTCIIKLQLSDFELQASSRLFLRKHESANEQSENSKTAFKDIQAVKPV